MNSAISRRRRAAFAISSLLPLVSLGACGADIPGGAAAAEVDAAAAVVQPSVMAESDVEAGRYLVGVAGCNDCHTDGYMEAMGTTREADWLLGSSVGFSGPWGTTYPPNLRLSVVNMTEDQWVQTLRTRQGLPPMPWFNVSRLTEVDARAIYRYIASLGPAGTPAPASLAPGVEPTTPWVDFMPRNLPVSNGS